MALGRQRPDLARPADPVGRGRVLHQQLGRKPLEMRPRRLPRDADARRQLAGLRRAAGLQLEQDLVGGRLHGRFRLTTK